jgi:hypothetical protein
MDSDTHKFDLARDRADLALSSADGARDIAARALDALEAAWGEVERLKQQLATVTANYTEYVNNVQTAEGKEIDRLKEIIRGERHMLYQYHNAFGVGGVTTREEWDEETARILGESE